MGVWGGGGKETPDFFFLKVPNKALDRKTLSPL